MKRNTQIPKGIYCYDENGLCPHWRRNSSKPKQECGYCDYLKVGDWFDPPGWGLLWDQVKECGINMDYEYDL